MLYLNVPILSKEDIHRFYVSVNNIVVVQVLHCLTAFVGDVPYFRFGNIFFFILDGPNILFKRKIFIIEVARSITYMLTMCKSPPSANSITIYKESSSIKLL